MPYINRVDYARAARIPVTPGELNYAITLKAIAHIEGLPNVSLLGFRGQVMALCHAYITRRGLSYTTGNEVLGVIACTALELIRRCGETEVVMQLSDMLGDVGHHLYDDVLAPYEDKKIIENGDVYPAAIT